MLFRSWRAAGHPHPHPPPPRRTTTATLADTREAIVASHYAALVAAGPAIASLAARAGGDRTAGGPPGGREPAEARVGRARDIHASILAYHRAASMRAALATATAARAAARASEGGGAAAQSPRLNAEAAAAAAELEAIREEVDEASRRRDEAFEFLREAIEAAAAAPSGPPAGGVAAALAAPPEPPPPPPRPSFVAVDTVRPPRPPSPTALAPPHPAGGPAPALNLPVRHSRWPRWARLLMRGG